jgi:hypothetical protein
MSHGAVAIYDDQWRFIEKVELPDDADPIDFAVLKDRVLITDLGNIRIYQLDFQGRILDEPLPESLSKKLETLSKNQLNYRKLSIVAVVLFVLFLVGGFVVAIVQGRNQAEPSVVLSMEEKTFNINNPHIIWIAKNQQKLRAFKLAMFMPLLVIPILIVLFLFGADSSIPKNIPVAELTIVLLLLVITPFIVRKTISVEIGVMDELLIIRKGKEYAVGKGKNIFYSDTYIVIDKLALPLNRQNMIFDTQQVIQKVMPLLREATYVKSGQMIHMLIKRQKPATIAIVVVAAGAIVGMLIGLNK